MKVLILGANGMLGHKLYQVLSKDLDVCGTTRVKYSKLEYYSIYSRERLIDNVNALNIKHVKQAIYQVMPDVVINCVGVIDHALAELERNTAIQLNALFPHQLKRICGTKNIRLVHISTDCVFSGKEGNYTEESLANATDVYGKSKYLGEVQGENTLTIRTSIIGRVLNKPHSLAELVTRNRGLLEWFVANRGGTVNGYNNAIFSGFPTVTFAGIIKDIILNHPELNGLYHVASNPIDKYTLLNMINDRMKLGVTLNKSPEFHCDRSLDATKFNKATGFKPRPWSLMLDEMAKDAKQYEAWR